MEVPWIPPPMMTIDLGVALVVVVVVVADIILREDDDDEDDDDDEKAWMQVVLNAVVINTGRSLGSFISLCSCYYWLLAVLLY